VTIDLQINIASEGEVIVGHMKEAEPEQPEAESEEP